MRFYCQQWTSPNNSNFYLPSDGCRRLRWVLTSYPSQQAHDIKLTSDWRWCDVITSHRCRYDVITTSWACWVESQVYIYFMPVRWLNRHGSYKPLFLRCMGAPSSSSGLFTKETTLRFPIYFGGRWNLSLERNNYLLYSPTSFLLRVDPYWSLRQNWTRQISFPWTCTQSP